MITNFIPAIWSSEILMALRNQLVFAQDSVINRDYEGDISQAGDTVHIITIGDPGIRDYAPGTDITWDELSDSEQNLIVDQKKYFAFKVDDVNKRQAAGDFTAAAGVNAAYGMSAALDTYVSGLMNAAATQLASATSAAPLVLSSGTPNDAYDKILVPLRTALSKAKIPTQGRWAAVPSEVYGLLLRDSRFIKVNESGDTEGLRNGVVGRAAGFDILESQTCPIDATSGDPVVVSGHPMGCTFADDLVEMEARRLENRFGDGIRGLHVYGGKVIRSGAFHTAVVNVAAAG